MLKGRLNNYIRADMQAALLAHAYGARENELKAEGLALRNEALKRLLTPAQIKAVATLVPLVDDDSDSYCLRVDWGTGVAVNCGGPKIDVGIGQFVTERYEQYKPIEGSTPILRIMEKLRLDLTADDDLAVRVQSWADRCEEYRIERKVSAEQIACALAAFSTVSQISAHWPEALPVVQDVLVEHLGRPAPSLPAVVITEMNAKLGLPPSNDDTLELTQVAA